MVAPYRPKLNLTKVNATSITSMTVAISATTARNDAGFICVVSRRGGWSSPPRGWWLLAIDLANDLRAIQGSHTFSTGRVGSQSVVLDNNGGGLLLAAHAGYFAFGFHGFVLSRLVVSFITTLTL